MLNRNTSWNAPYTFSSKEKDVETGYGYFGARYYDSGLSIWLSVDPMSDKYPSMSPYNYCANNPVILVDPDGRDIVDPDGNICYTKQDGWLPNAPDDTKRIGNAMMETETGKEQFNKLVESKTQFQLKVSPETVQNRDGNFKFGEMRPTASRFENGNVVLEKATITIFEGSINAYYNCDNTKSVCNDYSAFGSIAYTATIDQMIAATAGHETEHGTSQENLLMNYNNKIQNRSNRSDQSIEYKPTEIQTQILFEYKLKNK